MSNILNIEIKQDEIPSPIRNANPAPFPHIFQGIALSYG